MQEAREKKRSEEKPLLRTFRQAAGEGAPVRMDDGANIRLSAESVTVAGSLPPSPFSVLLVGIRPVDGAVAAALVPDELDGSGSQSVPQGVFPGVLHAVLRNGTPLSAGLQLLRHGDLLQLGQAQLWINGERTAHEEPYDPDVHGARLRCARSKALLVSGEAIVSCPGTTRDPGCRLIYRAAAWDVGVRCHECGAEPNQPPWEPPQPRQRKSLDGYLQSLLRS